MTTAQAASKCGAEDEKEVDEVGTQLKLLPKTLLQFTQTLRSFYAENLVTEKNEVTERFMEVRDTVAKNAVVYADKVLPLTQAVISAIGFFADTFNSLDLEDWKDGLEDIIEELEGAQGYCDMLRMMHNTIIQDLMKTKDKAEVNIQLLQRLKDTYEVRCRELKEELSEAFPVMVENLDKMDQKAEQAESRRWWATALAVPTLGIGYWLGNKLADQADRKAISKKATAMIAARKSLEVCTEIGTVGENSSFATKAAALTETHLIPSLEKFLSGLETCSTFLGVTKEKLKAMHGTGNKALAKDKKKMFYTMMKNKSTQLNSHCEMFLARSDMIQNSMAGITSDICNDEDVNMWFGKMIKDFVATDNETWARIQDSVLAITNSKAACLA